MTIVYLVLILRVVRADADFHDVPHAAVTLGTVLALGCVLALLVFVQEVSKIAVANEVVARVGREFDEAIEHLPIPRDDAGSKVGEHEETGGNLWQSAVAVAQRQEGYVQSLDHDALLAWAERHDAALRIDFRAGDFVVAGDRRILVWPPGASKAAERDAICEFAAVGTERTPIQDLEFAVRQLVEAAAIWAHGRPRGEGCAGPCGACRSRRHRCGGWAWRAARPAGEAGAVRWGRQWG